MARFKENDLAKFEGFPKGMNNVAREDSIPPNAFRLGTNIDLYPNGKARRRPGYGLENIGAANALWCEDGHYALVVRGTSLYRFIPGNPLKLIQNGVLPDRQMAYCMVNQYVYVSDGAHAWRVSRLDDSCVPWGVAYVSAQPTLAATDYGGLDEGWYQVAITWLRNGEEGGTDVAAQVYVMQGGGIAMTAFPKAPPDIDEINVYMTRAGGETLLYYGNAPIAATSIQIYKGPLTFQLATQFMNPMPAGRMAAFTAGRLFVIDGPFVIWSNALHYGLQETENNYVQYGEDCTLLVSTAPKAQMQGVFVGVENSATYFLQGADPRASANVLAYSSGAIYGVVTMIPGSYFGMDPSPTMPLPTWVASNGTICVGMPDGTVKPLTEGRFAAMVGAEGTAMFRELNGIRQAIFAIKPPVIASALAARDTLTITRVKNGVTIQ